MFMYYGPHVNLVDKCREIVCNIGMTFSISLTLNPAFRISLATRGTLRG